MDAAGWKFLLSIFDTQRAAVLSKSKTLDFHILGQRESEVTLQGHSEVQVYFLVNIVYMTSKRDSKLFKQLLSELPYNGINIVYAHGKFTNTLPSEIPSKK